MYFHLITQEQMDFHSVEPGVAIAIHVGSSQINTDHILSMGISSVYI